MLRKIKLLLLGLWRRNTTVKVQSELFCQDETFLWWWCGKFISILFVAPHSHLFALQKMPCSFALPLSDELHA